MSKALSIAIVAALLLLEIVAVLWWIAAPDPAGAAHRSQNASIEGTIVPSHHALEPFALALPPLSGRPVSAATA